MIGKPELERLYRRYNRRCYVHPDPLEFLYRYPDARDREVVGLLASSLAYGRVLQILNSVKEILSRMPGSPVEFIAGSSDRKLDSAFSGFKHRFTRDADMAALAKGIKRVIGRHRSLNACFTSRIRSSDDTVMPALSLFVEALGGEIPSLVPAPDNGSACKRMNLYLRWMVRSDIVDPGGWEGVSPAKLIVPLDTHMAKIGKTYRLTRRNTPGLAMALEITDSFRKITPQDPVRYDFCLTRFGINPDFNLLHLDSHFSTTSCPAEHIRTERSSRYSG